MDEVAFLHGLELLIICWSPVVALTKGLVAAAILNDAAGDGGVDGGGVREVTVVV